MYKRYIKRFMDIVLSGIVLIVLSPVFLVLAIVIRIKLGKPVFFTQTRPGLHGTPFRMYKFRTMIDAQTRDGRKITDEERLDCIEKGIEVLSDAERLPKLGRLLRATSLDELPELWNIFIGDMSIVGPRPLAMIYLPYYSKTEMRRHDVRPGLTGWAQVHGRNTASWAKRFEYDLYYVDHCSIMLDIKTIIHTIAIVFQREGIGQGEEKPEAFNIIRQREWEDGIILKDR